MLQDCQVSQVRQGRRVDQDLLDLKEARETLERQEGEVLMDNWEILDLKEVPVSKDFKDLTAQMV